MPLFAEFFAGIGLVRMGLASQGWEVAFCGLCLCMRAVARVHQSGVEKAKEQEAVCSRSNDCAREQGLEGRSLFAARNDPERGWLEVLQWPIFS